MKIALNTTAFLPGHMGGMETYLRGLFQALQEVDTTNHYSLLCDSHYLHELPMVNPNFTVVQCNYTKPSFMWFVRGVMRNMLRADPLRHFMNRLEVDVIHHPFSFLNPLETRVPSVLTFHDMQHEFYPELFSPYDLKVRKEFYRPSAEQATRIIAISEHAKSCLVERYEINPDKIDVIYIGFSSTYRVLDDQTSLGKIRLKYGLNRPFMYYPAATWPHKNHKTLLAALKLMKDRYRFDGELVLTGISKQSQDSILTEIDRLGLVDSVKMLGYLPYDDLPYLYNLARVMIFPSLFEGFGIPLVEAMACGCPVVCSNRTSIPEVVDDAGILFDPVSVDDIAEKAWLLWTDDALRKNLIRVGFERAKMFYWDGIARKTASIYKKTLS
jgi:glycosyltransferase involved in cell wall biosynthesis